jgi:hypothetical protein
LDILTRTPELLAMEIAFGPDTLPAERLAHLQRYAKEIRLAGF